MSKPSPDRLNPTFVLWPIQNARTAWRSVWIPTVLVVPKRRTPSGTGILNSEVFNVKFFIENAPGQSPISGVKYQGILVPELERFTIDVSVINNYQILLEGQVFEDKDTGATKTYEDAVEGDFFYVSLEANEVRDKVIYYPDANYYDLSTISISTIELKPYGVYNFVWQASYYERVEAPDGELLCITDTEKISRLAVPFNHPGDVHRHMVMNTPSQAYLEGDTFDKDNTVDFYRTFADVLQDVFDEQTFIRGINWVQNIPAQYIPYLGYLLGWDLPYFQDATDNIRRAFIRNARKLQKLKGSRRAINELFEIFGFTIDVVNLWYRTDGSFTGPYDPIKAGYEDEYVSIDEVCTTEPIISAYDTSGFGQLTIPLLYKAKGDITIEAWLVEGGATQTALDTIIENSVKDPDTLDQDVCSTTVDGFLINDTLTSVPNDTSIGYSKILVDKDIGEGVDEILVGAQPLNQVGVKYDKDTNKLSITFDRYLSFDDYKLYAFATYDRDKITPSAALTDMRSNRFDIRVLLFKDGEQPSTDTYDYLIDYLFKIKAFHSLLRKISFTLTYEDIYNVTDFSVGGLVKQSPGTDAGELQVPPAVIPNEASCKTNSRDFKDEDLAIRTKIVDGLEAEHAAWKSADGKYDVPNNIRPILESLSRVTIPQSDPLPCEWTQRGQDRVLTDDKDYDHNTDSRQKLCDLTGNHQDYTYKGRAKDVINVEDVVKLTEYYRCKPCELMQGKGVYWTQPNKNLPSRWTNINNYGKSLHDSEFIRVAYWNNELKYISSLTELSNESNEYLAIRKPSLQIEKTNMFFPGHRFMTMNKLAEDYHSSSYNFRPWDDIFNIPCDEDKPSYIPDLDTEIEVGTDGTEWLVFNSVQLFYSGNGLSPDIPTYGSHTGTGAVIDADKVTHKIYTTAELSNSSNPAIEYDTFDETYDTYICTNDPIFNSANRSCSCSEGTSRDYIDGYPSDTGMFEYDGLSGFTNSSDPVSAAALAEWAAYLDLPSVGETGSVTLLYKYGSGIRSTDIDGYRSDCSCLYDECRGTVFSNLILSCMADKFANSLGEIEDWHCDRLELIQKILFSETINTCSIVSDGTIDSFLLVDNSKVQVDTSGPIPVIHYKFIDASDTIHIGMFKFDSNTIDISWTTMEPRVWGRQAQGFIQNKKIFREGMITASRQVIKIEPSGDTSILAEGYEQWVGFFQTNFSCGDDPLPEDPFIYHYSCAITDDVEMIVNGSGE